MENKATVVAKDKEHLENLIKETIEKNGLNCDLNFIDVSKVTDMSNLFWGSRFNGDISGWNVSNVTNMSWMFCGSQFNRDISKWDVANVTNMIGMFVSSAFKGNISNWRLDRIEKGKGPDYPPFGEM